MATLKNNLPQLMRAAILVAQNRPLVVDEIRLPQKLEYGQILVKLMCSGICGSQLGEISGVKGSDLYLPHLLGHEGSGTVLAIGPDVKKVKPHDYVVLHWMKSSGIDAAAPLYTWKGKHLNAGQITTFNEYAIVAENRVTPIPKWVNPKIASLLGCAVTTGLGVITNKAELKLGQSIVVFGVGGVGLNIVQGAKLVSGYPIIGVDIVDAKLKLARKIGATHIINSKKTDVKNKLISLLGTRGTDVAIDTTGLPKIIELAYEITGERGKTILVGVPKFGHPISIYSLPLHFGKTITGTHGGETNPEIDIPRYIKLLQVGLLSLDALITDEFLLDDINTALHNMRSGKIVGRAVINYGKK